ncbi:MAG: sigma-54-dependent Fis family transcriptional regulator [Deltaproteobacteria bacterium]|nr:MAG: sigma-54-dependent Fis family transcriptional regulator [Deltaproteobacteria bacterium]
MQQAWNGRGNEIARAEERDCPAFCGMVGRSRAMRRFFALLRRVAELEIPVLLVGETGTGKELAARAIHRLSPRTGGPFLPINCAAVAREIFESELFGHERGAFTSAYTRKEGAFEAASEGTLFLDEIGELPLAMQAKLLRAIELKEIRRVGSNQVFESNARLVAATNRDLAAEVEAGRFRADLFYRLAIMPVHLPPLRRRIEDLELLVRFFLQGRKPAPTVAPEAIETLREYAWPGNVRELKNVVERSVIFSGGGRIEREHVCRALMHGGLSPASAAGGEGKLLERMERRLIAAELARNHGNKKETAESLGIAKSTLFEKLKRYGIGYVVPPRSRLEEEREGCEA